MTDQIADLLTRIKNASAVNKFNIVVPFSKMKEAILNILKSEGFVNEFKVAEDKGKKFLEIEISSTKTPTHLKQISKPGHRYYVKSKEIKIPLRGFGLAIISTSTGLISAREATKKGIGGELICEVW